MIEIVKAEEKHVAAIGKLWWEFMIFHQNLDHIFTPREGSILGFEENQLRKLMKSEDGLVLIALDGSNVVGFSLTEIRGLTPGFGRDKFGHINDMGVTASHRRKGIGEKMLVEIIEWLKSKNIRRVELGIAAMNQVAYSFWHKHGFEIYSHTLYQEIK